MKKIATTSVLCFCLSFCGFFAYDAFTQNPFVTDQFTADPTARIFEGKVYVYPSHDIPCEEGQGFIGFCMADYHVFSSENLVDWMDHGIILTQEEPEWVDSESFSMWAPDCISRDGKYYFYFPAIRKDKPRSEGRAIGVAISEKPYGPFIPEKEPVRGVQGIDPNLFIDGDGEAYLYWASSGELFMARMKSNMKELDTDPVQIPNLPNGFKEGPFLFERNGIYYLTFPHVPKTTERLVYATADNPMGPFKFQGLIMKESPIRCWTNHHSVIEYGGQWYLFYHHNDLSPEFDKNRSVKVDSLFFDTDGSIIEVVPTWRGVGLTPADTKIQLDRFTAISKGDTVDFLVPEDRFRGWKAILKKENSWLEYNSVDFGKGAFRNAVLRIKSPVKTKLELRTEGRDGPILAIFEIDNSSEYKEVITKLRFSPGGSHNLFLQLIEGKDIEVDWLEFK